MTDYEQAMLRLECTRLAYEIGGTAPLDLYLSFTNGTDWCLANTPTDTVDSADASRSS